MPATPTSNSGPKRVCFYHAGCPDGMGAAWTVHQAWKGEGEFVARGHDDVARAADWKGAEIVFVDIAPQLEEARLLAEAGTRLVVLDHHITARARFEAEPGISEELGKDGHLLFFDMNRSGAMIAWNHFHPDTEPPALLRYVQDQDLWNWELADSSEVNAAIASQPYSFEAWTALAAQSAEELAAEGRPILRSNRMEVLRVLKNAAPIIVDGHKVEAVNSTVHRAQVGHELAERARFEKEWGCVYRIQGAKVHATLYSIGDLDVSGIASRLGGGGHPNAAGFTVSVEDWVERFMR